MVYFTYDNENLKFCLPAGPRNDQVTLLSGVNTSRSDRVNSDAYIIGSPPPAPVNDAAGHVSNSLPADLATYEDLPSEDVTVNTTAVTAFTGDGRYDKLQRGSSPFTQSTAALVADDSYDSVEAYYGKLDNSEQHLVRIYVL